ncbi:MAG: MlaE family lipid ABC transporter permease subunit [Gallionellaceae bacterium]|nr:MlaE family lipid ABC transporter permease subunit [Gallionellaceae bacterium]
MQRLDMSSTAIAQPTAQGYALSGYWTTLGIDTVEQQLAAFPSADATDIVVDGSGVKNLDTVGIWILQKWLQQLRSTGHTVQLQGWNPRFFKLLELTADYQPASLPPLPRTAALEKIGRAVGSVAQQIFALLSFVGESAAAFAGSVAHPARMRWRPILHNIHSAGFGALPIVGLLSFLMGIVIAYQAADQLRQYGANIFVVDLVGLSMLREFAPLMTAIIVAGRSGSAFAAQIGSMSVSEEIDAMRTIGIPPIEMLVLPKIIALIIALPLLTFFADVLGVLGGMIMARAQLDVGFDDFFVRFNKAITLSPYLIGIGKAPVFAGIIAVVGCFHGFNTSGGADSVGRQTTRSVVQAIFFVIVADALFSILFSALDI